MGVGGLPVLTVPWEGAQTGTKMNAKTVMLAGIRTMLRALTTAKLAATGGSLTRMEHRFVKAALQASIRHQVQAASQHVIRVQLGGSAPHLQCRLASPVWRAGLHTMRD